MNVGGLAFVPIVLFLLCPACHAEDVSATYKVLNGNWRLTPVVDDASPSASVSTEYGQMTFTLGIDGNRISGEGTLEMHCPNDKMGFDAFVDGQISPDGTFILLNVDGPGFSAGSVVIKGSLPAKGTTEWRGQFSSQLRGRNGSCVPVMGEIVASQLPALKGIFLGTVQAQDGLKSEVTMEIAQGESITTDVPVPGYSHCVPLNVTMTIKNATGPLWGTFSKAGDENRKRCNRMAGENLLLEFTTIDGATLTVFGRLKQDKFLANGIALQIDYLSKDFWKTKIPPIHAIGELKRQSTTQTGANLIR